MCTSGTVVSNIWLLEIQSTQSNVSYKKLQSKNYSFQRFHLLLCTNSAYRAYPSFILLGILIHTDQSVLCWERFLQLIISLLAKLLFKFYFVLILTVWENSELGFAFSLLFSINLLCSASWYWAPSTVHWKTLVEGTRAWNTNPRSGFGCASHNTKAFPFARLA